MGKISQNNKGYVSILICALMPVIIGILGICIDGGIMLYYRTKLMTATKISAVSASSFYNLENNQIKIDREKAFLVADKVLHENFPESNLVNFQVNNLKENECTVEAKVKSPIFFMKILTIFNVEVQEKTLYESYTVQRNRV